MKLEGKMKKLFALGVVLVFSQLSSAVAEETVTEDLREIQNVLVRSTLGKG